MSTSKIIRTVWNTGGERKWWVDRSPTIHASLPGHVKVKVKVTQSCLTLCDPMDYTVHGILQARTLEWIAFCFSRGSPEPRDQIQVSWIAGRFLTTRATGKSKNTGVGSLSLLQWIFPTQESHPSLLHCGRILYWLNYQGSPGHIWRSKWFNPNPTVYISDRAWELVKLYLKHLKLQT